ncbi:phage terminase small subunit P27 family [Levilactobacillus tujiorum]|uniref:Phage terminase small subunit P27 family n=1 Tax=Levilactobacillus tujiorum TaxID=2912243 RepID=A0ABX1L5B4_9LACO|nr:phage terminase small subunit P27 family [Levilactobacillus tujiorum]NLR30236.1 phage terminase small subunit P27 family [Levilactobacillus tujiorum]
MTAKKKSARLSATPPDYLQGIARDMWSAIVPVLNKQDLNVTQLDSSIVEAFCINYQSMREAYENVSENGQSKKAYKTTLSPVTGEIVATDFVGFKRNPATQILDSATSRLKQLGNELGLTPASRQKLIQSAGNDGDENVAADLAKFFGKK